MVVTQSGNCARDALACVTPIPTAIARPTIVVFRKFSSSEAISFIPVMAMDANTEIRRKIAGKYMKEIDNPAIILPRVYRAEGHVFHLFPIITDNREKLQSYLKENGIDTQIHYPVPPYLAECYRSHKYQKEDYPNASFVAEHEVSLPIYAGMPEEEVDYVIRVINHYR